MSVVHNIIGRLVANMWMGEVCMIHFGSSDKSVYFTGYVGGGSLFLDGFLFA